MLKLKGKLDFTLFVKVEGVDPVNGKRPNRNKKKKFLKLIKLNISSKMKQMYMCAGNLKEFGIFHRR